MSQSHTRTKDRTTLCMKNNSSLNSPTLQPIKIFIKLLFKMAKVACDLWCIAVNLFLLFIHLVLISKSLKQILELFLRLSTFR